MSDKLPQTMCLGELQIVQTTNLHVTFTKTERECSIASAIRNWILRG